MPKQGSKAGRGGRSNKTARVLGLLTNPPSLEEDHQDNKEETSAARHLDDQATEAEIRDALEQELLQQTTVSVPIQSDPSDDPSEPVPWQPEQFDDPDDPDEAVTEEDFGAGTGEVPEALETGTDGDSEDESVASTDPEAELEAHTATAEAEPDGPQTAASAEPEDVYVFPSSESDRPDISDASTQPVIKKPVWPTATLTDEAALPEELASPEAAERDNQRAKPRSARVIRYNDATAAPLPTGSAEQESVRAGLLEKAARSVVSSAPDEENPNDFVCFNLTQALVESKAGRYMELFGMCTCNRCQVDVTAIALSNLPAKYVATRNRDVIPLYSMYEGKYSAAVIAQIMSACRIVMNRPHHKRT